MATPNYVSGGIGARGLQGEADRVSGIRAVNLPSCRKLLDNVQAEPARCAFVRQSRERREWWTVVGDAAFQLATLSGELDVDGLTRTAAVPHSVGDELADDELRPLKLFCG
jgi:hypothetical protein